MWLLLATGSAVSAGLVSVTVKAGMKDIDSGLGTFLRTLVVLVFTLVMVLITGGMGTINVIKPSEWLFITASGLCTGLSWLSYFKALQIGDVNKVVSVDKMSTALTMVLAIIILGEPFWWLTFVSMGVMVAGTLLMINKKKPDKQAADEGNGDKKGWLAYALLSLAFASLTSILAKLGMQSVDSNLGTFLRTVVVAVMAFAVAAGRGKLPETKRMTRHNWLFLVVSGCLTGVSWLCYYGAIQLGNVSVIAPIDRLSIVVTVIFSYFMFGEKLSRKSFIGLVLLTGGALLLLIKA